MREIFKNDTYNTFIKSTAVWPENFTYTKADIKYRVWGLASEIGKLISLHKKAMRGDNGGEIPTDKQILELGDVFYYLSMVAEYIHAKNLTCYELCKMREKVACYTNDPLLLMQFGATNMLLDPYKPEVYFTIVLDAFVRYVEDFDIKMDEIRFGNIAKLTTRKINDTIMGSGDR